jgi:hypothetical protein
MTSGYYHNPPKPVSSRVRCPVCHEAVYSRGDIHPQCAMQRSEAPKPKDQAVVVAKPVAATEQAADHAPAGPADPTAPESSTRAPAAAVVSQPHRKSIVNSRGGLPPRSPQTRR